MVEGRCVDNLLPRCNLWIGRGRRGMERPPERADEGDISFSIERPMCPAAIVRKFGIRKRVELGTSEMPTVQSDIDGDWFRGYGILHSCCESVRCRCGV